MDRIETLAALVLQPLGHVGARTFSELDAWKLANELKVGIYALLRREPAAHDHAFSDQLTRAAASTTANIAGGFGRYHPKEFGQFLRIANGSLMETSNHLRDGVDRGYFSPAEIDPLLVMARRASGAVTALIRYLRTAKVPAATQRRTREP